MSDDDIVQLKLMRDRGEISDAQYEVLRRHVLWGTPLPEAMEALAGEQAPRGRHSRRSRPHPDPGQPHPGAAGSRRGPGAERSRPAEPLSYPGPPAGARPAEHPAPGSPPGAYPLPPHLRSWPSAPGSPAGRNEDAWRRASPAADPRRPAAPDPALDPRRPSPDVTADLWRPAAERAAESAPQHRAATGLDQQAEPDGRRRKGAEAERGGRKRKGRSTQVTETASQQQQQHRQPPAHQPQPAAGRPPVPGQPAETQQRSRRRRGQAAFLLSMVLVVALVGAGVWWFVLRPVGVAPAEYARAVCSQVQGWHDDVTARSGKLQQALNSNSDPAAAQAALASFFDQVASRTGQLRRDIDGIGAPAISAGPAYVVDLDRRLDDTAALFRGSAQKSRDANVTDPAAFTITAQVLQSQGDQLIGGVTGSLADPSTPSELRTAYNNASGCAPFTG